MQCWPMTPDEAPRIHKPGWLLKACVGRQDLWSCLDSLGIEVRNGFEESVQHDKLVKRMILLIPQAKVMFFNFRLTRKWQFQIPQQKFSPNKSLVNTCQSHEISDWPSYCYWTACWRIPLLQPKVKHLQAPVATLSPASDRAGLAEVLALALPFAFAFAFGYKPFSRERPAALTGNRFLCKYIYMRVYMYVYTCLIYIYYICVCNYMCVTIWVYIYIHSIWYILDR